MPRKINDNEMLGKIFGDYKVIEIIGRESNCIKVKCKCLVCGRAFDKWWKDIKIGIANRHQDCVSTLEKDDIFYKLRNTHSKIKDRCRNPLNYRYNLYGARGINCEFEHFIDFYDYTKPLLLDAIEKIDRDMYKLSIDRINNNIGYIKGNLRFANQSTQVNNSSLVLDRIVTFTNTLTHESIVFNGKSIEFIANHLQWDKNKTKQRIYSKKYKEWTITIERCND